MPISRHSQNVLHSPVHAASLTVASASPAASRPRVSLLGNVTVFPVLGDTPELAAIQACYLAQHPDARWWLPGPREPHVVSTSALQQSTARRDAAPLTANDLWVDQSRYRHTGRGSIPTYVRFAALTGHLAGLTRYERARYRDR